MALFITFEGVRLRVINAADAVFDGCFIYGIELRTQIFRGGSSFAK